MLHANNDYQQFLRKICRKLGFTTTRNHAIRKYVNSLFLEKYNLTPSEKASLLGHSVEVNLRNYTFADNNLCKKMLSFDLNDNPSSNIKLLELNKTLNNCS